MATKTEISKFIKNISKLAIAECNKRTKKVCPSVCIAQAAIESAWGTSAKMVNANALFGIKATKAWINAGGKVYNTKTKEVYGGKTVSITDCFRAYDSVADSVADYYDLITGVSNYSKAINEPDFGKAITAIKDGGYCTDPDYVSKVKSIINSNNLSQYDACMKSTKKTTTTTTTTTTKKLKTIKNVVSANVLNVRASASATSKVVGTLKKGASVTISNVSGKWYYITSGKIKGWVSSDYITSTTGTTTANLNVRKDANAIATIIQTLKKGTTVDLIATKGNWYYTPYNGYVSADYIK